MIRVQFRCLIVALIMHGLTHSGHAQEQGGCQIYRTALDSLHACCEADLEQRIEMTVAFLQCAESKNGFPLFEILEVKSEFAALLDRVDMVDEAELVYGSVISQVQSLPELPVGWYIDILIRYGGVLYQLERFDTGISVLGDALHLARGKKHLSDFNRAKVNARIALMHGQSGNFKMAEVHFEKAIELFRQKGGGNEKHLARCLQNLGVTQGFMGRYGDACLNLEEALAIHERMGSAPIDRLNLLDNIGLNRKNSGDFRQSLKAYKLALEIRERIGAHRDELAVNFRDLGDVYSEMNEWQLADEHFQSAIILLDSSEVGGVSFLGQLWNSRGVNSSEKGDLQQAEAHYLKSIEYYLMAGESKRDGIGQSFNNLGQLYEVMGDEVRAAINYEAAIDWMRRYGDNPSHLVHCLSNLALLYSDWSFDESRQLMVECLQIVGEREGAFSKEYADELENMGIMYSHHDLDSSLIYFSQALDILSSLDSENDIAVAQLLANMAGAYTQLEKYDLAMESNSEALTLLLKLDRPRLNEIRAQVWKTIIVTEIKSGEVRDSPNALASLTQWSEQTIVNSFYGMSQQERSLVWRSLNDFIQLAVHLAFVDASNGSLASLAFDGLLVGKSMLLDSTRDLEGGIRDRSDSSLSLSFDRLISLRDELRLKNGAFGVDSARQSRLEEEVVDLEKMLSREVDDFMLAKSRMDLGWSHVRRGLSNDECAIEFAELFSFADSTVFHVALVGDRKSKNPRVISLCKGSELDLAWDTLRFDRKHVEESYGVIDADLQKLHELLWAPLESTLDSGQTVYYSGSGILNQLPFHAMYRTNADGHRSFVMDHYDLRPLSTTRLVAEGRHAVANTVSGPLLSLGGVDYNDIPKVQSSYSVSLEESIAFERTRSQMEGARGMSDFLPFGPLVGTLREVQGINQKWRDADMQVDQLVGSAASEHALKARLEEEVPAVLHIATHGFAFPNPFEEEDLGPFDQPEFRTYFRVGEDPLGRVGLILAGGNQSWVGRSDTMLIATGEDGILTAAEIADMDLRGMDLVVLSACETGLGELDGMEGTMGLFRAFKLAGVENVVQSFWSVPDKETQELMTEFYSRLTEGQDPQSAFSGAQKAMRNRYPNDPAKWAAFTLMR